MKIALMIILNIILNAFASFMLKIGMNKIPPAKNLIRYFLFMFKSPYIWIGGICFATGFLVYTMILQKIPLNLAYPLVTSGSLILITVLSYYILHEPITVINIVGIALILLGMSLVVR